MLPPVRIWSRKEMLKRVARFADLKGFSDGLQDSALPECQKTTFAVIGFQMPAEAGVGGIILGRIRSRLALPTPLEDLKLDLGKRTSRLQLVCARSSLTIPRVRAVADVLAAELLASQKAVRPRPAPARTR